MGELEDMINSVLSDPKQMGMISELAKSFMGGQPEGGDASAAPEAANRQNRKDGMDQALLMKIGRAMGSGGGDDKSNLLEAMKPYLSEKRRAKMDRAMHIARLARIARLAMGEMGDGTDV